MTLIENAAQLPDFVGRAKVLGDLVKAVSAAQQDCDALDRVYLCTFNSSKPARSGLLAGRPARGLRQMMKKERSG
jgi:hypothetical protein